MKKLRAFHNKQEIKDKYLKRVQAHYKADEIIQGVYWENGKGCAVGCTVEKSTNVHETMEKELGIPKELALLEDALFEELSNGEAKQFPLKFLKAIPVGADLSKVVAKFVIWQFEDTKWGLKNTKGIKYDKEVFNICQEVADAYKKIIAGKTVSQKEWLALYEKADKIYWAGAGSGTWAWAWARAGAWARAWAWAGAGAGAWARAWAWAGAGARARAWAWAGAGARARAGAGAGARARARANTVQANKLIELLKESK